MVIDKSNMKEALKEFPKQCRDAMALAKGIKLEGDISQIIVCGMGGSAMSGDILKTYMYDKDIPVTVVRDYEVPATVDERTLVFAVSYSGNTEETLSALTVCKNKNAKIIGITSGGQLQDLVDTVVRIPSGMQPRAALGFLFFPMIGILYNSGICEVKNPDLNEMIKILSDIDYFDEKGRELALKIKEKTPIIYSSNKLRACAFRFKTQINENAKVAASYNVFSELNHNELAGYAGMERSKFITIMIRDREDHERIKKRMDICKGLFEETVDVEEITTLGNSLLSRMFSVIYLGDWTSYHLAIWKRVDPSPVYIIESLKQKLKE